MLANPPIVMMFDANVVTTVKLIDMDVANEDNVPFTQLVSKEQLEVALTVGLVNPAETD